jgi:uncharacterized UBP type Zn finger protein
MSDQPCQHLQLITEIKPAKVYVCEECIRTGDEWLHLRTCQTCGTTLCCDNSPNKHATKHYHDTQHPVIISAEPGEQWLWCFVDEAFAEY